MISVAPQLWSRTLASFRGCGRARRECVTYWSGPIEEPNLADEVDHPRHSATAGSYEVESQWLHEFWVSLHRRRRQVRVQIHTHAFQAFHSHTDDAWPIVHTAGFCSLVVPNFATEFAHDELFVAELDDEGKWRTRSVADVFPDLVRTRDKS